MYIKVNSKKIDTQERSLYALRDSLYHTSDNIVTILEGYQTDEDIPLKEGNEVVFITKGELPNQADFEAMLSARHTPGVYQKVKTARVAIAGIGGLGSHIAISLARTGVGHLHLIDFDRVEPSNLNRQCYRIGHLGMPKTVALQHEIKEINPFITVTAEKIKVTAKNAVALFKDDTIVCEAFDQPEVKAMLVNTLLEHCPEKVIVAASGMAGYGSSNTISTRRITKHFYLCGDGESAAEIGQGLMAPRVSICAGHQANAVLRIILGETEI